MAQRAADGLLINGSQNNGASSPFALFPAFGNNRNGGRSLYNGGLGIFVDNSIWDARQFSLTGQNTAKPGYNHFTASAYFGGPLRIPHLLKNGPNFFVAYQWTRNRNDTIGTALMPTAAQRDGDVSPGILVPKSQISPQALALLNLYPLPNFPGGVAYNYQVPLVGVTHQDSLQSRLSQNIDRKNSVFGNFAFQNTRQDRIRTSSASWIPPTALGWRRAPPGFTGSRRDSLGLSAISSAAGPWTSLRTSRIARMSRTTPGLRVTIKVLWIGDRRIFRFRAASKASPMRSRRSTIMRPTPFPPRSFGIARVTISSSAATSRASNSMCWDNRTGAARLLSRAPPLARILRIFCWVFPTRLTVAFGNADKYFRDSLYDAFFTDDWRINSAFTLNAGMRWEYGSPITELYGRLVNLDVLPGFANDSSGTWSPQQIRSGLATGQHYPDSLIHPDKRAFEPRVGIAWRPLAASSLVIRAGYGVYYDTSVYQTLATQMAQQFPLVEKPHRRRTLPATPLTLATAFNLAGRTPYVWHRSELSPRLRPELEVFPFNAICPGRCK